MRLNLVNEKNEQKRLRSQKLSALREIGNPFPNDFRPNAFAGDLIKKYTDRQELLDSEPQMVKVAGRMMSKRSTGKATFADIQDMSGRIQLYVRKDVEASEEGYENDIKKYDIGDIIGAEGELFYTRTNELSVRVKGIRLLTKSLRPLPEKYHGLTDTEMKYRQRYLDLIMNEEARTVFKTRSQVLRCIREFMHEKRFLEVETPMMHPIPGGAMAQPFVTHHNALDMNLYLRIAPELYLKRLVVGGFDRVFEVNRNFRNEGVSTKHNPEFTMLEFYQAYADHHTLMSFTEEMIRELCKVIKGSTTIEYQGQTLDFSQSFKRMTMVESILHYNPDIEVEQLNDLTMIKAVAKKLGIEIKPGSGVGKLQMMIFEKTVEDKLHDPTFITDYPVEVSPLSRRNDEKKDISDRFELFIAGREIANGFSEINDPEDQAERFRGQRKDLESGNVEAMHFDADYIRALEYGMPPTAGEGIGIDRLVMLLTDSFSIRDVVLFPHMRHEPS